MKRAVGPEGDGLAARPSAFPFYKAVCLFTFSPSLRLTEGVSAAHLSIRGERAVSGEAGVFLGQPRVHIVMWSAARLLQGM